MRIIISLINFKLTQIIRHSQNINIIYQLQPLLWYLSELLFSEKRVSSVLCHSSAALTAPSSLSHISWNRFHIFAGGSTAVDETVCWSRSVWQGRYSCLWKLFPHQSVIFLRDVVILRYNCVSSSDSETDVRGLLEAKALCPVSLMFFEQLHSLCPADIACFCSRNVLWSEGKCSLPVFFSCCHRWHKTVLE